MTRGMSTARAPEQPVPQNGLHPPAPHVPQIAGGSWASAAALPSQSSVRILSSGLCVAGEPLGTVQSSGKPPVSAPRHTLCPGKAELVCHLPLWSLTRALLNLFRFGFFPSFALDTMT